MKIMSFGANNIFGVSKADNQPVQSQPKVFSQPAQDVFVKTIDYSTAVENTKKLVKDVILPNLDSETAIINKFDEESYPKGIVGKNGQICVQDKDLKKMFKTLAETIPGYASTYGRVQHDTHQYTLDVHTFKVLKECVKNPAYENLTDDDKMVLQMTVLLHDIAKPPYKNDREHPEKSAIMAEEILKKLDFPEDTNKRIVNLVKNHNWFEHYNKGEIGPEEVLKMPLQKEDFAIMGLISQGDTKSVNDWFYDVYCTNLPKAIYEISTNI